jgi:adenylate cyclase
MGLFAELRRRNVIRVALAYAVIAWVLAQIADLAFDGFDAPAWVLKSVLVVLALGFPLAVFFAWAFELTPEGVKKQAEVDSSKSITQNTGRKLDYLIIAVLAVAVGMLLVDKFALREAPVTGAESSIVESTTEKSLAVLPFVAMSNGPDDEYFADGLTEEILNSLAQLPELLVTARTSAFSFKGQDVPIPEIATALGVAHVVEGSVRRAGDRLRITAQLIRAHDGFHLWSETYDRSTADSFGVQGEIAEKVAAALDLVLDEDELQRMHSSGLRNPEAFIAYQKANEIASRAHEFSNAELVAELLRANQYLERVIELEPGFSAAYFGHADYYIHLATDAAGIGMSDDQIATAIEAADRDFGNAVRTAQNESERLNASLEQAVMAQQWQRYRQLLPAAYSSPDCMYPSWWGGFLSIMEPSPQVMAMWQRELACDPLNYYSWANVGETQLASGDHEAAAATATRAMESISHRSITHVLVYAHLAAGNFAEASNVSERYFDSETVRLQHRFAIAAAQREEDKARALLDEFLESAIGQQNSAAWAMLGDRKRANEIAAEQDASPLGVLKLIIAVGDCWCGAPFDLEATPIFARMVEEMDLTWPPPSPIEWPLKDW